jgi:hypothetical protein
MIPDRRAMPAYQRRAIAKMKAAIPVSGFRPATEAEWEKLQEASVELAAAGYRAAGATKAQAWRAARATMGGPAGRIILEINF